jgi:hypothetical protein
MPQSEAAFVKGRNVYKIFVGKREGKSHSEELNVDVRTILKWSIRKYGGRV